jgi:hypothetical protein
MRVLRTVIFISFVTLVALAYVHQQVELVKLSYALDCKEKKLKDMLDHNEGLGYNIENLEDPSRLEQALLAKNINVAFPRPGNIVRAAKVKSKGPAENLRTVVSEKPFSIFGVFEAFIPRAEAQTKN